jgi:signal peptidase I
MKLKLLFVYFLLSVSIANALYIEGQTNKISICPTCFYHLACTGSMEPALKCHDTYFSFVPADEKDIKIGDIIWFHARFEKKYVEAKFVKMINSTTALYDERNVTDVTYKYIVHRVVEIKNNTYTTKGDANNYNDTFDTKFKDIRLKILE